MCAPPPCLLHRSTPMYPRQADLRSSGPQSHHGGSHYSRAGRLSRSKEPLRSSCHPAPLRPVPTSGLDSSIHLQRQGRMKETLNRRKGAPQAEAGKPGRKMRTSLELTGFYMDIVSSAAPVVRQNWEQFPTAAYWVRGITPAQIIILTAMMMRPLCVYPPIATNLKERHTPSVIMVLHINYQLNNFTLITNKTIYRRQSCSVDYKSQISFLP